MGAESVRILAPERSVAGSPAEASESRTLSAAASRIRPFVRADIPHVASLYESVIRSGSRVPAPRLAAYFERTFFECPWADPEIPSLVYEDDAGKVGGFIGSHPRRALLDGRPIRIACSGQLITDPKVRSSAAGALLMRRYMSGPQELTITDGATEEVRRMWEGLGGQSAALSSLEWIRVFRPSSVVCEYLFREKRPAVAAAIRPLAAALDTLAARAARSILYPPEPAATGELLTPAVLAELLPSLAGSYRISPAYDPDFLAWLFREMTMVESRGTLVPTLVRSSSGKVRGWYVYYLRRGGISDVVHVAAAERNFNDVLDHLFHHAAQNGATALRGRLERPLVEPLSRRRCVFRYCGMALVHSPDPEILRAVQLGQNLLTRMDGEWWMGPHIEPLV